MYYVGADLHKDQTWFYLMDKSGKKIVSKSVSNTPESLKDFFAVLPTPFILAVEATYNWYFFIDIAELYAEDVLLANSYDLKAFAKRHKKTDKIDARLIADVLRKGYLPTVFIPDKATRVLKELLHCRMNFVRDRSRAIFRTKNTLDKLGVDSTGDFTTAKRLRSIPIASLLPVHQAILNEYIQNILLLSQRLEHIGKTLKEFVANDIDINNLDGIEGIDSFSGALIKTEIGTINRFPTFNHLCAYAGLAPRVSQSGNKTAIHGPLMTNRRKNLQWILLEVVYHFIQGSSQRLKRWEELKKRKGSNTAKVIMARHMLKIIYHILKERRPYYGDSSKPCISTNTIQSVATAALQGV